MNKDQKQVFILINNVGELLEELNECNKNATVSSIIQMRDKNFYEAKVLRAGMEEEKRVVINAFDISDKGITVKELIKFIESYDEKLPVFVKEMTINKPPRYFEILSLEKHETLVTLKLPQALIGFSDE